MPTPEERAEWRTEALMWTRQMDRARRGDSPSGRILALLDALDAAERRCNRYITAAKREKAYAASEHERANDNAHKVIGTRVRAERAEAALTRIEALIPTSDPELIGAWYAIDAADIRAALRGDFDATE